MAYLRRAVDDSHLFIVAGKSQGAWRVTLAGEI
jgi:hypothetical protein